MAYALLPRTLAAQARPRVATPLQAYRVLWASFSAVTTLHHQCSAAACRVDRPLIPLLGALARHQRARMLSHWELDRQYRRLLTADLPPPSSEAVDRPALRLVSSCLRIALTACLSTQGMSHPLAVGTCKAVLCAQQEDGHGTLTDETIRRTNMIDGLRCMTR